MSNLTINNKEFYLTDNAQNESNIYKCSFNSDNQYFVIGDDDEDCREYLIEFFGLDDEIEIEIDELCTFTDGFNDEDLINNDSEHCSNIVDYMLSHSGDSVSIESYIELVELVENASDDESIEHSDMCREFRLISDSDIDEIYQEYIEEMVKDCYLPNCEIPSFLAIDWEQTAENCKTDGYGHSFSGYDHSEENINGTYIFCTN